AVGPELEELRRRRAIGRTRRVAARQREDMALGIDGDAGAFAEIKVLRQVQRVRHAVIGDGRNIGSKSVVGRQRQRRGTAAGRAEKAAARQSLAQTVAAAKARCRMKTHRWFLPSPPRDRVDGASCPLPPGWLARSLSLASRTGKYRAARCAAR